MFALRLSALGDVTHVVPLVRTLQRAWPEATLHWVIDPAGRKLLDGLEGVTFHGYDKRSGLGGMRALGRELAPLGRFDMLLLQMQVAFRANVRLGLHRRAPPIGYDPQPLEGPDGLFVSNASPTGPARLRARRHRQLREPWACARRSPLDLPVPAEAWNGRPRSGPRMAGRC